MENPEATRRADSSLLPNMATASTDSTRRTASRCTRPINPVPKIAVLIVFIQYSYVLALRPPGSRGLLAHHNTIEEIRRFGEPLSRREQAVLVLDRDYVIIAKHPKRGD